MKKTLRKFLIYLLAIGMLMPTWLVTGMLNATHAKAAGVGDVVVNEIYWNGSSDEWIELYNSTNSRISIAGWQIDAAGSGVPGSLIVPAGSIPANGYYLIADKDSSDSLSMLDIRPDYIVNLSLLDAGEQLIVKDELGNTIDTAWNNTNFIGDNGHSMSRKPNMADGTLASSWDVSAGSINLKTGNTVKATPGYLNDNTPPAIFGVTEGSYYKSAVSVGVTDDDAVSSITLDSAITLSPFDVNAEGPHTIIAKDMVGNTTTVNFTIDQTAPVVTGVLDKANYGLDVTPLISGADTITLNSLPFTSGTAVSIEGDYVLTASDLAGNTTIINFTLDKTAPIVTGALQGVTYDVNVAPVITDLNINTITLNNLPFVSGTTISKDGSYTLVATDLAGNTTIVDFAIKKVMPVVSPDFTVTVLEGKNFRVDWNGNGADSYIIKVNGNADPNGPIIINPTEVYSRTISVSGYGTYEITLIAVKGGVESTDFKKHSIELKTPVVTTKTTTVVPAPTPAPAPVVSAAPAKAKAAEPQPVENKVQTPADDSNGQIKGDESSSDQSAEEKINWTPWIVLFVLILLAGAATGGYFYWFNGEDEVQAVVREPKKESSFTKAADDKEKKVINKSDQKKQKRW
ncbi:MAG: lamin tail domain-containing protein [Patescibacteria group bacterium]|nr:lamin tail domain-containing protein [Patescibacteria group bacterium]